MARSPEKSDGAFRTIREVADWLGVPTHVLRFWESKFDQIAPVKGAGGRRYYRPEDMKLLGGIKVMLHDQGLTIRGVQQKIADDGTEPVMELSPPLDMPEGPPARTRRVIRNGEDTPPGRVVSFEPKETKPVVPSAVPDAPGPMSDTPDSIVPSEPSIEETVEVGETAKAETAEAVPDAGPPDTGSVDSQPTVDEVLAEPATLLEDDPVEPPAPLDPIASDPVSAEPVERTSPEAEEVAPTDPAPGQIAEASAPAQATGDMTPVARALQLARASAGITPDNKIRLRRVIRRYKALVEEIQDDLDGQG